MLLILSIVTAISIFVIIFFGIKVATELGGQYEEAFKDSASQKLSDMFIFIEPKKLYIINLVVLFSTFSIIFLVTKLLFWAITFSIFAGLMPKFLWNFLKQRRNNRFLMELPDALLSMSSMMRAGTNLNVALETVVAETPGPISQEFGLFLRELRVGVDYDKALDNLKDRMQIQELELVVAGMKISREIGGSLAEVLFRLSDTLRKKIEMEGKIKALTAQGKAQGYVMTLLPVFLALVLYKMEHEAMSRLFTEWFGWVTCAIFVLFEIVGYYFIRKIVNIDV